MRQVATIRGQVISPPGLFGSRTFYLQDSTGGIRVTLDRGSLPALAIGDWVTVTGWRGRFAGAPLLHITNAATLQHPTPGTPPRPHPLLTGRMAPAEGQLVQLSGGVVGWQNRSWTLNDGSGSAEVNLLLASGLRRPYLRQGQGQRLVGIVVQAGPMLRLVPRTINDLSPSAPPLLPATGGP
jgi:hypothetical protein